MSRCSVLAVALALAMPAAATAADPSGWRGQITPYVWGTGISGDITPFSGGPHVDIDKSFSELLKDLDAAFFLSGYARNGRFVIMGDISHSSSTRAGLVPPGVPADGKLEQTSLTLLGGYRVHDSADVTADLLAGARMWWISASANVPAVGVAVAPDIDFIDPIVAARFNIRLAPRWSAIIYADIGGFGVGSETTAQLTGTVNWQVNDSLYLSAGYRHLQFDYEDGGTKLDMEMGGPILGVTWRF